MDIITVVFRGDMANLLYQANSLKVHWKDKIKNWHIIVEDDHITPKTLQWCQTRILPMMDDWNVNVISAPLFIKSNSGWYRQQILKLWAASTISKSDYSLILDGKNFLLYPIDSSWFFTNEKLKVQVHHPENTSTPWVECCEFFNKDPNEYVRPYNLTPWVFRKDLAQNTIDEYTSHGCNIFKVENLPAFEFEAYWLLNQNKILWEKTDMLDGIMAGYKNVTVDFLKERIEYHKGSKKPFWLFHRYEYNNLNLRPLSDSYLKECDVITDDLIKEWETITEMQTELWPNVMRGVQPPDRHTKKSL
jgi:hypothetical protein